ncbi:MAG: L-seryl-tRNA(Sec) selenium transferase [Betaproteobacteria bacterium]
MNPKPVARAPVSELLAQLPSVDKLLLSELAGGWVSQHGRDELLRCVRFVLNAARQRITSSDIDVVPGMPELLAQIDARLIARARPNLRRVINLTGTVLHTNLGRAVMPDEVIEAMASAAAEPCALEYDLGEGKRGDRDELVEELLCELTGAEAATVVNNNAAAVFLLLNALSNRKETIVSRGELIEIGGAFRIPDIMKRAGARLVEVGTTNRTHPKDFAEAIGPKTALVMKVHTSNYVVQGFTAEVAEPELANIAHVGNIPFVVDLGAGTLVDLTQFGLPKEPTPAETIANGADLVTFSCDKLLGGPQAGILVGRKDLIQRIKKNPLKRVLRVGKVTLAALESVLRMYRNPATLPERVKVLQLLTRPAAAMQAQADRLLPSLREAFASCGLQVSAQAVKSQIGSGSLPVERLPSVALAVAAVDRSNEKKVVRLERLLRGSETAVIGRISEKTLLLDLRCLTEDKVSVLRETMLDAAQRLGAPK